MSDSTEQSVTGPILIPSEIELAGRIEAFDERKRIIKFRSWVFGCRAQPLFNFGVSISKGKTARTIMVGGWKIAPFGGVNADDEKTVVDRIRVLVNREPGHRRCGNVRRFQKLSITLVEPGFAVAVVVPIGQENLGHQDQGILITREVTNYLNLSGAAALLLLAWDLVESADRSKRRIWCRWFGWAGMLGILLALMWLHPRLDRLLDLEARGFVSSDAHRANEVPAAGRATGCPLWCWAQAKLRSSNMIRHDTPSTAKW